MSIPKEKLIIQEIKRIVNKKPASDNIMGEWEFTQLEQIRNLVNSYVDPGYIGGPVVGEEVKEKVRPVIIPNNETRF